MIEFLPLVLTGLGLTASIVYYSTVLRNSDTTRRTQLLLNIKQQMNTQEFWFRFNKVMMTYQWKDYQEFSEKYSQQVNPEAFSEILSIAAFFNGIGVLVATGVVDIDLLCMHLGNMPVRAWVKMEPIITEYRKEVPLAYSYFEYLKEVREKSEYRVKGKASYLNEKLLPT